jgi:hypothetical protein
MTKGNWLINSVLIKPHRFNTANEHDPGQLQFQSPFHKILPRSTSKTNPSKPASKNFDEMPPKVISVYNSEPQGQI